MDTSNYEQLHRAVSAIASQCDGAIEQDGVGFNGHDTKFGRRIANYVPADKWDDDLACEVYSMLRTYRVQLSTLGIDYDSLPKFETEKDVTYSARNQARQAEYAAKNQPYTEIIDGYIHVFKSYEIKDDLKRNGFTFNRPVPNKAWQSPLNPMAAATVIGLHTLMSDEVKAKLESLAQSAPVSDSPSKPVNITVNPDGIRLDLATEWGQIPLAVIRAIPGRKWDGNRRVNIIDANIYLYKLAEEYDLTISDEAKALIESNRAANEIAKAEAELAMADSLATDTDVKVEISDNLYPFQRAGVAYALKHPRTFIGDEMGLGKTRQGLSTIETTKSYPCLIICPATLKLNWEREIKSLLPHRSVSVYSGRNSGVPIPMTSDYLIINYDILPSWVEYLPELGGLIVDESQNIKNEKAQRTLAVKLITLGKYTHDDQGKRVMVSAPKLRKDGPALFLTGTPLLNRPKELVQPLMCMGHLTNIKGAVNSVGKFLYRYCDPQKNGWGTTFNGSSNELELNEWLRKTCMVRRTKRDVLTELPSKIRAPQYIELSESSMRLYLKLAREGAEKAAQSRAEAIVYLNALRTAIGEAKIAEAITWATDFLESTGKQLIIFADHIKVQRQIIEALTDAGYNVTHILGGEAKIAEEQKAEFMSGKSKVIVLSLKAASIGHTLTAASDVLTVELGWNPGTHNQAEDRAHRIGQTEPVTAFYLIAQNTIDEWTHELIEEKRKVVNAVTDGIMSLDDESSVFNEVLERAIAEYGGR